jgi:hypothetical protein
MPDCIKGIFVTLSSDPAINMEVLLESMTSIKIEIDIL